MNRRAFIAALASGVLVAAAVPAEALAGAVKAADGGPLDVCYTVWFDITNGRRYVRDGATWRCVLSPREILGLQAVKLDFGNGNSVTIPRARISPGAQDGDLTVTVDGL